VRNSFYILSLLIPLIGLQLVISCSEEVNKIDLNDITSDSISSSSYSSSFFPSSNSIYSSSEWLNSQSSSSAPPPVPAIDIPPSGRYTGENLAALVFTVPPETEQYGTIRCETTGATPSESSSIQSGDVVDFSTSTTNKILQCAYFKDGNISGKMMRTYIIERLPDLPIVSIAADPERLAYLNGSSPKTYCEGGTLTYFTGDEEIPIYVDFFEKGAKESAWSYPAGMHVHGGCSRMHPKKSMVVSFKEEYGQKNLNYPLFPEFPNLTKFKHFMLRNNGNNYPYDYIRDMLMSSLTEGLGIDYQKGRAVVVYYNGKYYGIHNLRERANGDYFETNYGINENNIDLVKLDGLTEEVKSGSDADYQALASWLNSDISLADDDNYKKVENQIDVDNFTNHFQSRIFYKDCDWPGKNMKRWRAPGGKWRWLLYDTDHGFGSWGSNYSGCGTMEYMTAKNGPSWPNPPNSTLMLRKLLENQNYKYAFINRFSVLIATYFTTARMNERRSELLSQISSETSFDEARWAPKRESELPQTMSSFASTRPASMQSEIEKFFSLGASYNLTLSVEGRGKIFVHNLELPASTVTFKAYSNVPITIKAGTGFKRWSDDNTENPRTINITEPRTITAIF